VRSQLVPELYGVEWELWINEPNGLLICPTQGCGQLSRAHWDGVNEVIQWARCKHRAFIPEHVGAWPPPETHVLRDPA